ncbi:rRNA methyltransferase [Candidatus Epulonipiscium fishelsonii]|uniref:rRNA methyltransferase n=1 Tax=Candidatus Epulonipiscium fishelsonii TaxID=77094 RepID=A0ACC8X8J7_9FIRM|nr:rRNA methyltransferase [Epulopiscium sp. SCG-D08WGA-EpuloA1]OON93380.1 MAG: rRNA methyltransferase [Epulopiscium sp. AS2M-Bin002]
MAELKERLDILIFKKGLAESRERAKAYIMAGVVYVDGQKEDKAGLKISEKSHIEVRQKMKYVSRGGFKLEKAISSFEIKLDGKICMDVGASTGGFTDCMLQEGAKKVYAVDVGYGQLAWKLRQDERVVCLEKTNMRYVTDEIIQDKIDFCSIDVSFISLTKILPSVKPLLSSSGSIVALIKPQFEAGREQVEKNGVVRNPKVHEQVINMICENVRNMGFYILGLDFSPIKGPEGNREYLIYLCMNNFCHIDKIYSPEILLNMTHKVVDQSHKDL